MTDLEKVQRGLKCMADKLNGDNPCAGCGYMESPSYAICVRLIAADALALLQEQEGKIEQLEHDLGAGTCPVQGLQALG